MLRLHVIYWSPECDTALLVDRRYHKNMNNFLIHCVRVKARLVKNRKKAL